MTLTLPRSAYVQRDILELFSERSDRFVALATIAEKVYGKDSMQNRMNVRQALFRLRERFPGLEIEAVTGYRIKRAP